MDSGEPQSVTEIERAIALERERKEEWLTASTERHPSPGARDTRWLNELGMFDAIMEQLLILEEERDNDSHRQ